MSFILCIGLSSCIEPFTAETNEESDIICIEGGLVKGELEQSIIVSKTTSYNNPKLKKVSGCTVSVFDNEGSEFHFEEGIDGIYRTNINSTDLEINRQYMLRIITPEGNVYESEFDTLREPVPIDTLYWEVEEHRNSVSGEVYTGVQFYIDIDAQGYKPQYFRWRLEETYEYNSIAPISYYYVSYNTEPKFLEDQWLLYTCWNTSAVEGLYHSKTSNLLTNRKKQIKLNYVSNQSERLQIKYSMLAKQYSVGEGAYNYFEQNRLLLEERDGFYTRQPAQPITNLCNINECEELVLGYFWVGSMTSDRIMVKRINDMEFDYKRCMLDTIISLSPLDYYPKYIYIDLNTGRRYTSTAKCFDCRLKGGTIKRPWFWELDF